MYVTAGAGHRRAAEALADTLRDRYPNADIQLLDVLTLAPGRFHAFYAWSYLLLVRRFSWIWKFSYALLDLAPIYRIIQPIRRGWNLWITRRLVSQLATQPPDLILTTHFLPADVCSAGRGSGWLTAPLVVVVTDLHPHRFWISRETDAFVIATNEGADVLARCGVARERIHTIGIPISKRFGEPVDRAQLRERFQLPPNRLTVLVTSGGTTVGRFESVVESLLALETAMPGKLQLIVVCGENHVTHARLEQQARTSSMPLRVFGFVDYMAELMAVSDLIVTKAGGLTVSEALGRNVPMILYHVIPGQERANAEYVMRRGAARIAHTPQEVALAVHQCLQEPQRLEAMRQAVRSLSRPDAAATIVSQVIDPLVRSMRINAH